MKITSEGLRESWQRIAGKSSESEELTEISETIEWLDAFSELLFEKPSRIEPEVYEIFESILNTIDDPDAKKFIHQLKNEVKTISHVKKSDQIFQRMRETISLSLRQLRTQQNFDAFLSYLKKKQRIEAFSPAEVIRENDLRVKMDTLSREFDSRENQGELSDEVLVVADELVDTSFSSEEMIPVLLDFLAVHNSDVQTFREEFSLLQQEALILAQEFDPSRFYLAIQKNSRVLSFIQNILLPGALKDSLHKLIKSPELVTRVNRRQYGTYVEVLRNVLSTVGRDDLTLLFATDSADGKKPVLPTDTMDGLEIASHYTQLALRVEVLEKSVKSGQISLEEKKLLAARFIFPNVQDLNSFSLPQTLLEDIIENRVTSQDLTAYGMIEWLVIKQDKTEEGNYKNSKSLQLPDSLQKVIEVITPVLSTAGKGIAVVFIFAILREMMSQRDTAEILEVTWVDSQGADVLGKVADPRFRGDWLPLLFSLLGAVGLSILFQKYRSKFGGGASLDFQNPFEGMEGVSKKEVWSLRNVPLYGDAQYFRVGSSEKFDPVSCRWVDTTEAEFRNQHYELFSHGSKKRRDFGVVAGKYKRAKKAFNSIPLPYGTVPLYFTEYSSNRKFGADFQLKIDRASDGSLGIDTRPADRTLNDGEEFVKDSISYSLNQIDTPYRILYPMNIEKCLVPIISEEDLPLEARELFEMLDRGTEGRRFTKTEEAGLISSHIRENFFYSIDPKNTKIYKQAHAQGGMAGLFATLFEKRKVKCDGAATVAVALMRLRKIPARHAVGFQPESSEKIVLGDLHGWVEAFVDGELKILDPTPIQRDDDFELRNRRSNIAEILEKFMRNFERKDDEYYQALSSKYSSTLERMLRDASLFPVEVSNEIKDLLYPYRNQIWDERRGVRRKGRETLRRVIESLQEIESQWFESPQNQNREWLLLQLEPILPKRHLSELIVMGNYLHIFKETFAEMLQDVNLDQVFSRSRFEFIQLPSSNQYFKESAAFLLTQELSKTLTTGEYPLSEAFYQLIRSPAKGKGVFNIPPFDLEKMSQAKTSHERLKLSLEFVRGFVWALLMMLILDLNSEGRKKKNAEGLHNEVMSLHRGEWRKLSTMAGLDFIDENHPLVLLTASYFDSLSQSDSL